MALDEGAHPDFFAGIRVAGEQLADDAEFVTGAAVHQQHLAGLGIFDQCRCAGHGVAGAVIAELLVPDDLAGVLVQRHDTGVEGAEVDLVAIDGRAAVDHVAARADVIGQAMGVAPQALAGLGIEGEDARVGAGHVDHAVMDDGLGLLAALLLVAEGERPSRGQFEYVALVDLRQRAPALCIGAHAVLQDVLGGQMILGDVFPADRLGLDGSGQRQAASQRQALHSEGERTGCAGVRSCCHGCDSLGRFERGRRIRLAWRFDYWERATGADTENVPRMPGILPKPH